MTKLKFILSTKKMEFEIQTVFKSNYFFANVNMTKNALLPFEFPSHLQLKNFHIEKLLYNEFTGESTWDYQFQLNNTYKKTGYFETYNFTTPLENGYYRIRVGTTAPYISYNLLKSVEAIAFAESFYIVDEYGNNIVDFDGGKIIEPL